MHFVDRGPEPDGLETYRVKYTPRWVEYYEDGTGTKPSDTRWTEFHDDLKQPFFGLCGYCEANCRGEVDHFRPKSRVPLRVYDWSNWVFACHDCNHQKGNKWPSGGYVDPCARLRSSRPEEFFEFDFMTGEILARAGLTPRRRAKAQTMIDDLKLNASDQLKRRLTWICAVEEVLKGDRPDDPKHEEFVQRVSARDYELSSVTRALLADKGH